MLLHVMDPHGHKGFLQLFGMGIGRDLGTDMKVRLCFE